MRCLCILLVLHRSPDSVLTIDSCHAVVGLLYALPAEFVSIACVCVNSFALFLVVVIA